MKYLSLVALVGLSLIGTAEAACTQANAKGTWTTYQAAFIGGADGPHVGQCTLVVDKMGSVNEGKSSCQFVTFNTGNMPTKGTVSVDNKCNVTISLELGSFSGNASMTSSKNAWAGRFTAMGGAVAGVTNAVKIAN